MRRLIVLLTVLASLFNVACSSSKSELSPGVLGGSIRQAKPSEPTVKDRQDRYKLWIDSAMDLANKTKDEYSLRLMQFVNDFVRLVMPEHNNGLAVIVGKNNTLGDALQLLDSDINVRPYYELEISGRVLADLDVEGIVLGNPNLVQQPWRGLRFISVATHAQVESERLKSGQKNPTREELYLRSQTSAQRVHELLQKLAGTRYIEAIQQKVAEIETAIQETGRLPYSNSYPEIIDAIFGPPFSEIEKEERSAIILDGSIFTMLEAKFGNNVSAKQNYLAKINF